MKPTTEKSSTPTIRSSQDRIDQDGAGGIANAQDRALLVALQQFIIPHIGAVANEVEIDEQATQSILLKPEAVKLITAFKEFIASITSGVAPKESPKKGTVIRVGLNEQGGSRSESSNNVRMITHMPEPRGINTFWPSNQENVAEVGMYQINPELHAKALRGLREHVFNKMPIRLLRFIPKSTHLEISLIEREEIYAHLVSIMQANLFRLWLHSQNPDSYSQTVRDATFTIAKYAILSHTWLRELPGEITYGDWHDQNFDQSSPGYQKLVNFCKLAWLKHGLTLGWMDTICINKESSSELDESIRSMYKWYQGSHVCIAYLSETLSILDIRHDRWFTRGWTLQELIAPFFIKFCNRDWDYFDADMTSSDTNANTSIKAQIINQINKATTITIKEFHSYFFELPLSRRMQLAANREVTREEDTAYSLMGIFDVSISTAYGEGGERAFFRLLGAILNSTSYGIFDLFNWGGRKAMLPMGRTQLLPPGIKSYVSRSGHISFSNTALIPDTEPLVLTHIGIRIPVVLMPGIFVSEEKQSPQPIGDYRATAQFSIMYSFEDQHYFPIFCVLDRRATANDPYLGDLLKTLAILNIRQISDEEILIPKTCIAKALPVSVFARNGVREVAFETEEPIVFEIQHKTGRAVDPRGVIIRMGDLAAHGMRFTVLYL